MNDILTKKISKNVNVVVWEKTLKLLNFTQEEIFYKSETDRDFAKLLASTVCKNSSRQCVLDEELQIKTCNDVVSSFGVFLEKIPVNDSIPLKSGKIVSRAFIREHKISKNDCLKSFDAKITGKLNGYVFAKIVIGSGGHQDNVFEEAYSICDWVVEFGLSTDFYIVLIDTDSERKLLALQEKFPMSNNINLLIGNCAGVQQHFIEKN